MYLPKISVITPSYNQGQYIEENIVSVSDQGYSNLEYIIIDGGSKDNTVDIIKKYEKQLTYWVSEKDKGQSEAINKGFELATGDIINWLNSDDYLEVGALQHVANQFEDSSVNCYMGISRKFGTTKEYFSTGTDIYAYSLAKTIGWARIDQPETFFRKTVIDEVGSLNECLHYVMDKDLWIRYLCKYGLSGLIKDNKLLVHFRHHESSKTVALQEKFNQETLDLFFTYAKYLGLKKYCALIETLWNVKVLPLQFFPSGLPIEEWIRVFNYLILYKGFEAYASNDYNKARQILKHVEMRILDSVDQKEFSKIVFRMKLLPVPIKKLLNRL